MLLPERPDRIHVALDDHRLESWPETDRIMARGYTPGNQG